MSLLEFRPGIAGRLMHPPQRRGCHSRSKELAVCQSPEAVTLPLGSRNFTSTAVLERTVMEIPERVRRPRARYAGVMTHPGERRVCCIATTVTPLSRPSVPKQGGSVVELGTDAVVVETALNLILAELVALSFTLPGQVREINAIAKVVGPSHGPDRALCELTFLPQFERGLIRVWLDRPDPHAPAARHRVGRVG
jgi:hypothetical protein